MFRLQNVYISNEIVALKLHGEKEQKIWKMVLNGILKDSAIPNFGWQEAYY